MLFLKGECNLNIVIAHCANLGCREGAANLSDMKEMLASLPQYQEQREKVSID